jgi:hypothetical protein
VKNYNTQYLKSVSFRYTSAKDVGKVESYVSEKERKKATGYKIWPSSRDHA